MGREKPEGVLGELRELSHSECGDPWFFSESLTV